MSGKYDDPKGLKKHCTKHIRENIKERLILKYLPLAIYQQLLLQLVIFIKQKLRLVVVALQNIIE